jgi:hypothetical protein
MPVSSFAEVLGQCRSARPLRRAAPQARRRDKSRSARRRRSEGRYRHCHELRPVLPPDRLSLFLVRGCVCIAAVNYRVKFDQIRADLSRIGRVRHAAPQWLRQVIQVALGARGFPSGDDALRKRRPSRTTQLSSGSSPTHPIVSTADNDACSSAMWSPDFAHRRGARPICVQARWLFGPSVCAARRRRIPAAYRQNGSQAGRTRWSSSCRCQNRRSAPVPATNRPARLGLVSQFTSAAKNRKCSRKSSGCCNPVGYRSRAAASGWARTARRLPHRHRQ